MESVVATVVANEILGKFSSDNMEELKEAVARHRDYVKNLLSSISEKTGVGMSKKTYLYCRIGSDWWLPGLRD